MKTKLIPLTIILLTLLLASCGPDKHEARLAALEKQMAEMQDGQAEMRTNYVKLCELSMRHAENTRTNLLRIEGSVLNEIAKYNAFFSTQLTNFFQATIPAKTAGAYRPVATLYRDGIPASIYAQIAADAAKDYPGQFSVQEYTIREEVEAYKKLHQ